MKSLCSLGPRTTHCDYCFRDCEGTSPLYQSRLIFPHYQYLKEYVQRFLEWRHFRMSSGITFGWWCAPSQNTCGISVFHSVRIFSEYYILKYIHGIKEWSKTAQNWLKERAVENIQKTLTHAEKGKSANYFANDSNHDHPKQHQHQHQSDSQRQNGDSKSGNARRAWLVNSDD